jgi:DNA-binding Lrp family transcriptional regulator
MSRQIGDSRSQLSDLALSLGVRHFFDVSAAQDGSAEMAMVTRSPKLDRIDIKILSELQKNGRLSNVDLAEAVGLSPSPCLKRVKGLQKAGFIVGYNAQIDLAKLGQTLMVFTEVTLSDHRHIDFSRFEAAIRRIDEVVECHLVSGGYDYLLKFITRGITDYQEIIEHLLEMNVGIEKYFSYVVIKSPFVKNYYPLSALFDGER